MNRVPIPPGERTLHSMPRTGGIAGRIAHAERADRNAAAPEQAARKKEYEERIGSMLGEMDIKPEIEIQEPGA